MKIQSLKAAPELLEQALAYCEKSRSAVYGSFRRTAEESLAAEALPQTFLMMGKQNDADVLGFCQLARHDDLTVRTELTPFVKALFVDPDLRGGFGWGEMLLTHAKYEAARLGYEKLYVCTDHIGYYEKYGFREIGQDIFTWGRACKVYECDTPAEITFGVFDKQRPKSDELHLALAYSRWKREDENPAALLHFMKYFGLPDSHRGRWHQVVAFRRSEVVGAVNLMQDPDNPKSWYLGDLFVVPEYRRRGIARKLITRGIDELRRRMNGGETVHAVISPDNHASRALHGSLGFAELGRAEPFCDLIFDERDTVWELKL